MTVSSQHCVYKIASVLVLNVLTLASALILFCHRREYMFWTVSEIFADVVFTLDIIFK